MATMIIEGKRTKAASGKTYKVHNPATGEVVDLVPAGDSIDVDRAAQAAAKAFTTWSKVAPNKRAEILHKATYHMLGKVDDSAPIVAHRLIRKIALTGSTPTGKRVMARAAEGLKKITLELGGSDPCIVLDDADLEAAARAISVGRFFNCGQACLAVKRLYVQEGGYNALIEKLVV